MKKEYLLTIGMPSYYDYTGVMFTVENIREFHDFEKGDVEILIVDNTSSDKYRDDLKHQIEGMNDVRIRYIPFTPQRGPAETKNVVLENAKGEYTLCIDCHVNLKKGVVNKLRDFLTNLKEEDTDNFYVGPLIHNRGSFHTHFDPVWRGQMWGIWGTDPKLLKDDSPKDVWGQGCGLFLVKTDSWLGFNKDFNGFGGEEGYIHEKYRKAGRKVQILPWLRWWHRFGNPDAKQYKNTVYAKTRNYVLGHNELGLDPYPIYDHFVSLDDGGDLKEHLIRVHGKSAKELENLPLEQLEAIHNRQKMPQYQWDWLIADPVNRIEPEKNPARDIYPERLNDKQNNLREHYPTIRRYAEQCSYVADITRHAYSTLPLMIHKPKHVLNYVYDSPPDQVIKDMAECKQFENFEKAAEDFSENQKTEMLFIKFPHKYRYAADYLEKIANRVSKYILIHDTTWKYNEDITNAMKLLVSTGEWYVREHYNNAWGLTVLSREKPETQALAWAPTEGPGTELKKILAKFGIVATENCSCNKRAQIMDLNGPQWCRDNMESILEWLQEEAVKRKKLFVKFAVKQIVLLAIRRAEKKVKNDSKDISSRMVGA